MISECENPYCTAVDPEMRAPTAEELLRWEDEAREQDREQDIELLREGEVQILVCLVCGAWTAEMWDEGQGTVCACFAPPFRFAVGDKVRVTLEGKRFGVAGTIQRRQRLTDRKSVV